MLSFLEGRVDDWITTATGQLIHPQAVRTMFTEEQEVWRYQVVQQTPLRFRLALVTGPGCDRIALNGRLTQKFAHRFGDQATVEIAFVRDLPRTPGGKVRTVVGIGQAMSA